MPPVVDELVKGNVEKLEQAVAQGNFRAVRKAINYPLVVMVAMELKMADNPQQGEKELDHEEFIVIGGELTKVYLAARDNGFKSDPFVARMEFHLFKTLKKAFSGRNPSQLWPV